MTEVEDPRTPVANVLVVDDMPQALVAMQALLERPGLRVLTAASATQALELLLEHEVALALLDVRMPVVDGFELAELMRGVERTRSIPIIFLTASPVDANRPFRGYEAGAVDFLHKPIDAQVIVSKVAVFVELYQQRRLLRERSDEMERLLKINEIMIAVLTHDLRTPLSAILMSARLLRLRPEGEGARLGVERIETSGKRMVRMIDQLLHFSRIRAGVVSMSHDEADLHAVCMGVVGELRQSHPARQIDVTTEGDLRGRFDTDRLAQVFSNLLSNALSHGEPEQPVTVRLDGSAADRLQCTVRNAGSIPDETLVRMFEPFKGSRDQLNGLGLGLYIVHEFLRAHGGDVTGRNVADGVEFSFSLPRVPGEAAPGDAQA
jgi:two-component system sensor histidine kinase/response regulator